MVTRIGGLSIGDLVEFKCYGGPDYIGPQCGIIVDLCPANLYEPAEARVYFGKLKSFEWLPVRSLSLAPDEER